MLSIIQSYGIRENYWMILDEVVGGNGKRKGGKNHVCGDVNCELLVKLHPVGSREICTIGPTGM